MVICVYLSSEGGHRPVAFKEELQVSIGSGVGGGKKHVSLSPALTGERDKQPSTFIISTDCCVSSPVHIAERDLLFKLQCACVCV